MSLQPTVQALSQQEVKVLLCLDAWLIQAPSCPPCDAFLTLFLSLAWERRPLLNLPKSHLNPIWTRTWLSMEWDSPSVTLRLSSDNCHCILSKVCCVLFALGLSRNMWESLLCSLIHPAQMVPLDRIQHHYLSFEGNCLLLWHIQVQLLPLPLFLPPLFRWWLDP